MITEKDVIEYQDIYYEYLKPFIKKERKIRSKSEIENFLNNLFSEKYPNWTTDKFQMFQFIDLSQRLLEFNGIMGTPRIDTKIGNEIVSKVQISMLPELRCHRRSEQDKFIKESN